MWYNTYNTHEAIFDIYQQYILSGFRPKNLVCPQISWEFGNFNDQNNKFKQNLSFEVVVYMV